MPEQAFTVLTIDGKKELLTDEGNEYNPYRAKDKALNLGLEVAHVVFGDCRGKYEFNQYTGTWQDA